MPQWPSGTACHVGSKVRSTIWTGLAALITGASLLVLCDSLSAQDDQFTYGRTPIGAEPAGSIFDTNRQGIGFAVRGGHEAGGTVGRADSTSLFGLSPYLNIGDGLLFGDSRLTYTNRGGVAYSFGGGYRHYITAWDTIAGINGYFDRDEITGVNFQQWGIGGELLSHGWELRGNWYQPYGERSSLVGSRTALGSERFVDTRLLFDRIDTFSEAVKGFDAEAGVLLPGKFAERFDIRGFGGGYYYVGDGIPGFTGFSTRLQADIADWLELGLKLTNDDIFHTNVTFNAVVHFGGFHSQEHTKRSAMQRMAEPVRRNLNIVASISDVTAANQVAQKADGSNLSIIHVNSNAAAGGDGTVEHPFTSLSTGLGVPNADIVFTHAGSVFDAAPDNQIELLANQILLGEGTINSPTGSRFVTNDISSLTTTTGLHLAASPTFLADMTLERPMMLMSAGDAVTMAENSRFGGFVIDGPAGVGISASNLSRFTVSEVLVSGSAGDGIFLKDLATGGTVSLIDTEIVGAVGAGLHVDGGDANILFRSTSVNKDPSFGRIENSQAEALLVENRTGGRLDMFGTTIDHASLAGPLGTGIVIRNDAGTASIDNAKISDTIGTGISVTDSSGSYTFQNSLRTATEVINAGDAAVFVSNLQTGGSLTFRSLTITDPNNGGIDINDLGGTFTVAQDTTISFDAQFAGTTVAPFISVDHSLAGAVTRFSGDISLSGGANSAGPVFGGRGIELINSLSSSNFEALGRLLITNVGAEGIAIVNDASAVRFGSSALGSSVGISDPVLQGILMNGAAGPVVFAADTVVSKTVNPGTPLVDIQNSAASPIVFQQSLDVSALTPDIGVNLIANHPSPISFANLIVSTTGGTGLFASDNFEIQTSTGTFDAINAAAIDIFDSGINMTLETVTSSNSPTFGISLQETNKPDRRTFTVRGDNPARPTNSSGGIISDAANEGVLLQNAGVVTLAGMQLDNNEYGVRVLNTGITETDDQMLRLFRTDVFNSDVNGVFAVNLSGLEIDQSTFGANGDTAGGNRQSIRMQYTELPSSINDARLATRYDDTILPYVVSIHDSMITDESDDAISIENVTVGTAAEAQIFVEIFNNTIQLDDVSDFGNDVDDRVISMIWNGPAMVDIHDNTFSLTGTDVTESGKGIYLEMTSRSGDLLEYEIASNAIVNTTQPETTGLRMIVAGSAVPINRGVGITNNNFTFSNDNPLNSNADRSIGMQFNLGPESLIEINSNILTFDGPRSGGLGIEVRQAGDLDVFTISNNIINLPDVLQSTGFFVTPLDQPDEDGIIVRRSTGTYFIQGTGNVINFDDIEIPFLFLGGLNPGDQIEINGTFVP
ncbi:MAG: inverse autotransporter beta domain-containing protein [Planctomycetaceae bacterium]